MTTTAATQQDRNGLRNVKMMIGLAIFAALASATAGIVLWLTDPVAGSTSEAALGFTAAIGGLGAAAASISAAVYSQVKGLWKYAPAWVRGTVMLLVVIGIVVTVTGWINQLIG
jgi:hypothetical protein